MRIPKKSDYYIIAGIIGLFLILGLIAGVQTCRQIKDVESNINRSIESKINSQTIPITIHDIATKKTSDSLEEIRRQQHVRIDAASVPELQSWIDSAFNFPGGYPDQDGN